MNRQKEWLEKRPSIGRDGTLPPGLDLEKALICAELSQICYRHHNRDGVVTPETLAEERKLVGKYAQVYGYQAKVFSTNDQQAAIFYNDKEIIIAFEGSSRRQLTHYDRNLTSYFMSWFGKAPQRIIDAAQTVMGTHDEKGKEIIAKVHWGFDNELNEPLVDKPGQTLWNAIKAECNRLHQQRPDAKITFTGHSSGGAIATIATARMLDQEPDKQIDALYTFGQPRVGGKYFRAGLTQLLGDRYYRFEQYGDPMPALPPYDAEQYVHGGHWIPMDLDGHVLTMNDDIINSDTLSRANQGNYGRILNAYYGLTSAIGGMMSSIGTAIASKSKTLSDLIDLVDEDARRTHSSLKNVFSAQSYDVHRCAAYSRGMFNALEKQSEHRIIKRKELEGTHAQHLLYQIESLEYFLTEKRVHVPQPVQVAMARLDRALSNCLDEWERLLKHQHDPTLRDCPAYYKDEDTPYFGISFGTFLGMQSSSTPSEDDREETFVSRIQPARQVRRWQRASRVGELNEALNQFCHDIGSYTADPNANWYLRELDDMATQLREDTAKFRADHVSTSHAVAAAR